MWFMLRALRRHPLLAGTAEVLVDAVRYIAVIAMAIMLLGAVAGLL
jgi:hypothetical protein